MDQQEKEITLEQIKSCGEWIGLGKQNAESDRDFAVQCYEKALELTEDKYEPLILIAQAHRMFGSTQFVLETLPLALNLANDKIDRLIAIACEYKHITYDWHALEIHGWVKELDPTYDHEVPKTYEDYQEIFKEYILECKAINRIHCATRSIEKIIELSPNKIDDLIQIGSKILLQDNLELAQKYFIRALEIQEDKYDVLLKIGDVYLNSKQFEKSEKYYTEAYQLKPDILSPKIKIAQIKLELQQFQDALDYINSLIIPLESQTYIDIGLIFSNYGATYNEGVAFIQKGIDLSENKYQILTELIKKLNGKEINKFLLQKAIAINGQDLEIAEIYAQHLNSYGQETSQETIDIFKLVLRLDPKNIYYADPLKVAYVQLERVSEAIEYFKNYSLILQGLEQEQQILELQIENFIRIGSLLFKTKQFDEGFKFLNQALQNDITPTKKNSFYLSALILFDNQLYDDCMKLCDQNEKYYPQVSYFHKAQILRKQNRIQEAINFLELAQSIQFNIDTRDQIEQFQYELQQQDIKKNENKDQS